MIQAVLIMDIFRRERYEGGYETDSMRCGRSQTSVISSHYCVFSSSITLAEKLSRQDVRKWLSPPDPSINHDTVHSTKHEGTATWFFQGDIYKKWKSAPSLLWIHGKRKFLLGIFPSAILHLIDSCLHSWLWQERPLVRGFYFYPTLVN